MLFLLKNTHTGAKFYLLKQKYVVGRKNCDFLIENDLSISRKHAVIDVEDDKVTITDAASKYKSLLNGEEMKPNVCCPLEHGDEIQFGVYNSKFRLEQQKFVTTATRLPAGEKTQLKNEMEAIHGSYVEEWSHDCTHLTVKEIALTVKVLYALIDDKPIIIPQYWTKLKSHVTLGEECPKIEDYSNPPVNRTLLSRVEWKRGINRTNLFKNKLFIFLTENSRKTMEGVIGRLGGTSIAWEKKPMPLPDIQKSPKQIIVIQPIEKTENSSFQELTRLVLAKGERLIPQQEIALACVAGNCEKDCNPEFDRASEVFCNVSRNTPSQSTVIAQNTESQAYSQVLCKVEEKTSIIGDTFSPERNTDNPDKIQSPVDDEIEGKKREASKRHNDSPITNVSKKIRTEDVKWTISNSNRSQPTETMRSKDNEVKEDCSLANSQKRKASNDIEENSPTRNPFLSIGKKIRREKCHDENNPFIDIIRGSKEDVQPDLRNNPFLRPRSVPKLEIDQEYRQPANILSSTANTTVLEQPSFKYSRITKSDENLNVTWVSKKSLLTSVMGVKEETQYDDYVVEFRNQFKDKVVIECTSKVIEKSNRENSDRVDNGKSGKSNFKKFKKVFPLHPQKSSINQTAMVSVTLESQTATEPVQIFNDNDEDDTVDISPIKRRVKKMVL